MKNQLYLRGNDKVSLLSVYDVSGHEMMKVKNPGNTIALSSLTPGIYVVVINRTDGTTKQVKIVKQ